MSRYGIPPFDLSGFSSRPLSERDHKVQSGEVARPFPADGTWEDFLHSVPHTLAGADLRDLAAAVRRARAAGLPVILGFGGHVVKCGLGPVVVDLIERGVVTGLATNGSGTIHDIELALVGHTSEDVAAGLADGTFGSARETQDVFATAVDLAGREGLGLGEALGSVLDGMECSHGELSIVRAAYRAAAPLTVHVAIGTDTVHLAPEIDPGGLGRASHHDLRLLTTQVRACAGGGVYLNFGSAVVLPEVLLKAVTAIRNAGESVSGFVTANFDFIQHYRPRVNVVQRPTADGGRGFSFTGHHELMLPLLAAMVTREG